MRKIATHKFFDFYINKTWLVESFLLRYLFWVIGGQLIENQLLFRQIYKEPLIISYKPGRSLKDILVKAKLWELKAILKHVGGKREVRLLFIMWYVAIYRAINWLIIARQFSHLSRDNLAKKKMSCPLRVTVQNTLVVYTNRQKQQ